MRLRDEMGLAYSTFASITMTAGMDAGRFIAYIGTSPDYMKLAIEGLLNEIRRIVDEPVTPDELKDAQDFLTGSFVFAFESSSQIARFLIHAHVYGLGFDFMEKYPRLIRDVTAADIARVARQYLDSENYTLTVVGPVGPEQSNPFFLKAMASRSRTSRTISPRRLSAAATTQIFSLN